jgi:hypothetical protein
LCCSFLHILQDLVIGNKQKSTTFWDRVQNHFNELCLDSCALRSIRSLETKWGIIKHDVAKFVGHYTTVLVLCESRIGIQNTLQRALDLYKTRHLKHQTFTFIHVWYVLKNILRWANLREKRKKTSPIMKSKANFGDSTSFNNEWVQGIDVHCKHHPQHDSTF